jgi:hypothetical protein
MDALCPHHEVPVKYALKDRLIKNYINGTLKPRATDPPKKAAPPLDNDDGDAEARYPSEDDAFCMIFGGSLARPSRCRQKLIRREVFNAESSPLSYLKWSEVPITFDRKDHPDRAPKSGAYPLVVAPLFRSKRVHKVLMDRVSGINMLYVSTLDNMGIPQSKLRPSTTPFNGVIPGMEALTIGQIDLPIKFVTLQNFYTETLTFEVVGFSRTYHAILRRLAYAKFMAVPNYTYLKLKIPGPKGIITVGTMFQRAFECDAEYFQFAEALIRSVGFTPNLTPRTKISPSRPSERPALSSPPRMSRMRPSLTMAACSVSGWRSILNRKVRSSTSSKRPRRVCMETVRHEGDPESGCRAQVEHKVGIETGETRLHRFNDEKCKTIGENIKKLLSLGFIREVFHPEWLANPVLVKKKNKKSRMCVDYTGLNKECPKDPFPLPRIDQVVDSIARCETLCFLDAYSGYHQIAMCIADQLVTSFISSFGAYCYKAMPFGLKNAGTTFQRSM